MKGRSWTTKDLKRAIKNSTSIRQVITKLGLIPAGGNYEHVSRRIKESKLSTTHFKGKAWNKGMRIPRAPIYSLEEILVQNSHFGLYRLKERLFKLELKKRQCEECGWAQISADGRIPIELDHINGDRHDNRIENLRILCPNCHSLKLTHRGRNKAIRRGGETGRHATLKTL